MYLSRQIAYFSFLGATILHVLLIHVAMQSHTPIKKTTSNNVIQIKMVQANPVLKSSISQKTAIAFPEPAISIQKKIPPQVTPQKKIQISKQKNDFIKNTKQFLYVDTPKTIKKENTDGAEPIENHEAIVKSYSAVQYKHNPPPPYPEKARMHKQQGTVWLSAKIQTNGIGENIKIVQSSGYAVLDRAALRAVQQWKFIPASRENLLIEETVEIPITFTLKKR